MPGAGWARALRGREPRGGRARSATCACPGAYLVDSPEPVAGLRRSWRGDAGARRDDRATSRSRPSAARSVSYAWLRLNLTELELRAGEWDAADRLLDEWADTDDGSS